MKENNVRTALFRGFHTATDLAYYVAFVFCVGWVFIKDSTMFRKIIPELVKDRMDAAYHAAAAVLLICAVIALLRQDSIRLAVFGIVITVVSYIQYRVGGLKFSYYVLCLMILGAVGKSFRRILTIWLILATVLMAAAFFASQAGIIEDLVYKGNRHSYGIVYCTDCAAHVLFLMMSYTMLRLYDFRVWEYGVHLLGLAFMWGTYGKTNIAASVLLIGGIAFYRLSRRKPFRRFFSGRPVRLAAKAGGAILCLSFPVCAILSFASTLMLGGIIREPHGLLTESILNRLQIGYKALQEHPFSLFGTKIKEHSLGGKTTHPDGWWVNQYFFIDNSYIRLYLFGGVILFCLFLSILVYVQIRCYLAEQYMYEYFLLIMALVCMTEHHMVDFVFHVFPLLAFSSGDILTKRTSRSRKKAVQQEGSS